MIQAKRLGHVSFQTTDLVCAIEYFTGVVGLVVASRERDRAFLGTKLGQLAIELTLGDAARCQKLSFEIAAGVEPADVVRRLTAHGLKPDRRSDAAPGLAETIAFADPKGTQIELFSRWGALGRNTPVAGIGPIKIGHLAYVVPDPQATAAFYREVLGFRVSDWIEDQFVFLRCNIDHHTVNFIKGDAATMHHFAFELRDCSHIQTACEHLAQHDIPIIWGPVRLGPGHNIAVFHKNPDGQVVEFYAELDRMLDEELDCFEPRPWHRDLPQRPKVWERSQGSIWGLPPSPAFPRNFSRPPGQ